MKNVSTLLRSVIIDGSVLVGGGLLTYGAMSVYQPAGFIVAGVLLLSLGLSGAKR